MQENKAVKSTKSSVVFHIFAVMLLVTFISCHVISGTVAKYVSSEGSSDGARVANFTVTANGNGTGALNLKYGESTSYTLQVNNTSEVAVTYQVIIQFADDVQNKLDVTLDNKSGSYDSANHSFTFTDASYSLAVGASVSKNLVITGKSGLLPGESEQVKTKEDRFNFATQVLFEQIN